jgi:hypothetical protein
MLFCRTGILSFKILYAISRTTHPSPGAVRGKDKQFLRDCNGDRQIFLLIAVVINMFRLAQILNLPIWLSQ